LEENKIKYLIQNVISVQQFTQQARARGQLHKAQQVGHAQILLVVDLLNLIPKTKSQQKSELRKTKHQAEKR
jgi:hypothetical protein